MIVGAGDSSGVELAISIGNNGPRENASTCKMVIGEIIANNLALVKYDANLSRL